MKVMLSKQRRIEITNAKNKFSVFTVNVCQLRNYMLAL